MMIAKEVFRYEYWGPFLLIASSQLHYVLHQSFLVFRQFHYFHVLSIVILHLYDSGPFYWDLLPFSTYS